MFSHFSDTAGFWALLGVPLVLAIHFLQQKAKKRRTSTLFLMEALSPESAAGRTWERLRMSRAMWLQLLAVLLCAWILLQPRFVREASSQSIGIVLDDSLSMAPFRDDALAAARDKIKEYRSRARRTQWLIAGSSERKAALYRGTDAEAAIRALDNWRPSRGSHEVEEMLGGVNSSLGQNGVSWFITNAESRTIEGQPTMGVGRSLANVGFVGTIFQQEGEKKAWRVAIRNHSAEPQTRTMTVTAAGVKGAEKVFNMEPNAVVEELIRSPGEGVECVVSLTPDEFTTDDVLPLIEPRPRPMGVSVEVPGKAGAFFRKLVATLPGLKSVPPSQAGLRIVPAVGLAALVEAEAKKESEKDTGRESSKVAWLAVSANPPERKNLLTTPIVSDRDPLSEGLTMGALLSPGPVQEQVPESAQIVYWQGGKPLVWRQGHALVLNWGWEESNADRLPAVVLLMRRYMEEVRLGQKGSAVINVPLNSELDVVGADEILIKKEPFETVQSAKLLLPCRAPNEASFFQIKKGGEEILSGSSYFDDVPQGDFSACSSFFRDIPQAIKQAREAMALSDPLVPLWIVLMMGALIWSWWPERRKS